MTTILKDEILIEAGNSGSQYWRDVWRYRELFYILAWRDIAVRYKQTSLGIAWALIRPFLTMIVFTVIFGTLAKLPSESSPYAILVFSAVLPWQFFSSALSECSNSLIVSSNLVSKVYFPRLIIPASSIIVSLVDFLISAIIMIGLMGWYHFLPSFSILSIPLFIGLLFLLSIGLGLWLSALTVEYRDFRYVVPFVIQLGFYVSPVGFSSEIVPEKWRILYLLNPMVGIIDGFRWAIMGGRFTLDVFELCLSITLIVIVFFSGILYFRRVERQLADLI